jgi:hypothetical protein
MHLASKMLQAFTHPEPTFYWGIEAQGGTSHVLLQAVSDGTH